MITFRVRFYDHYQGKPLVRVVSAASEQQARAAILDGAPAFRYVVRTVQPINQPTAA